MATKKENKRKMIKLYLTVIASFVVLVAVWAALAVPDAALAKKPSGGGGKGGSDFILVRANFVEGSALANDSGGRVVGFTPFLDADGLWQYWDSKDFECGYGGELKSDLSGGGRWIFNTGGQTYLIDRWVVFHWTPLPGSSAPNLDEVIYDNSALPDGGPDFNPDPEVDNLNIRMSADMVFKDNSTRQSLSIPIQQGAGSGPIYYLYYLEPLYVEHNYNGDPNLALLTSFGSDGNPDVHNAELVETEDPATGEPHRGNTNPTIGTYSMPFKVILKRVYIP